MKRLLRVYRMELISPTLAQFYYSEAGKGKHLNVPVKNRELITEEITDTQLKGVITRFYKKYHS